MNKSVRHFDVFVSYSEEDKEWVDGLVEEVEDNDLSVCLRSRDFDSSLSLIENRKVFVEQCSSCILIFTKHYCKRASEWSYFTKYIKSGKDKSIAGLLDNKGILCVYLSECNVPELFSKQKMLDWTAEDLRDLFWQRLMKFLKAAQKKSQIKKALSAKVKRELKQSESNLTQPLTGDGDNGSLDVKESARIDINAAANKNLQDENEGTPNDEFDKSEDAKERNVSDYILFDNVYPHLVTSSFSAEDEDLTKEEVENLTLKMEDVQTLMLLNEKDPTDPAVEKNNNVRKKIGGQSNLVFEFESQHEQMQLVDTLQTIQEKMQSRLDALSTSLVDRDALLLPRKKRYRRLLQRYQDCLMQAVNGRRNRALIDSLPFVTEMLENYVDVHGFKCDCCGSLFHSKRALEMHFDFCVTQRWRDLIKYVPKSSVGSNKSVVKKWF